VSKPKAKKIPAQNACILTSPQFTREVALYKNAKTTHRVAANSSCSCCLLAEHYTFVCCKNAMLAAARLNEYAAQQ
jgi:hypothetical protein